MKKLQANQAVIVKGVAGQYSLHRYEPYFSGIAVARGIFRKDKIIPLPGDLVEYSASGDPDIPFVIENILPRKNELKRPPMANLDILLITVSTGLPEPDFYLIDRMAAYANILNITPYILLTKTDIDDSNVSEILDNYRPAGFPIYQLGFENEMELQRLKNDIRGEIVAFAGQSGVGKSTYLNLLFGNSLMETGELSHKAGRGKQTTRHIELFPTGISYVADTPGFQTLNLAETEITGTQFAAGYPEINRLSENCRFNNCTHLHEPGCAVIEAGSDQINPKRLKRYQFLRSELDSFYQNMY
ncbi:MAG TPA: ribosome small subunit-dependent GTPase A [Clostridiaceae bacterium]|nr:ribosome small subunit-dependent GTPase A [Clostridiaceae bacterium]